MPTITEDALLAALAARAGSGADSSTTADLRQALLPACERIAGGRGDGFLEAVVDAACREVLDWAGALRTATCRGG
jgi:hypothetical protein